MMGQIDDFWKLNITAARISSMFSEGSYEIILSFRLFSISFLERTDLRYLLL
jgi:hypothetical protein